MFRALYLCPVLFIFLFSCTKKKNLFSLIDSAKSGIHFNNTIIENDTINVLDFENVYNGGGVGIGDFNNDGLQDIYFTGNMVSNKLYLNKGNFQFDDITTKAGVTGSNKWCRGIAVVDINNDGLQDMYISSSIKERAKDRQNLLYINQGIKNGIPVFKELAAEYGLADTTHSTMASFFDYDNDGDLDVYITVNEIVDGDFPNRFRPRMLNGEHPSTGVLYRNDWQAHLNHPFFTNVSKEAKITIEGYGHNASISDFNLDGWKDIYVTNDYISSNILYINNRNGTFTDKVTSYFKHTAANAMGSDVVDINNDGLQDLIELDMNPEDNYRKKMMMNANSYQTYQNSDQLNYQYQYVRNVLQVNQGPRVTENDSIGDHVYSDVGFFAGIAETDWSWAPVVVDFDNDGFRDIIVTNGFPRDVTDKDFGAFRNEAFAVASKKDLLEQIPEVKMHNYAFQNRGDLTFADRSKDWGLGDPSFSNGAAYADLDNDGDMDLVINNINDEAFLYENTVMQRDVKPNYLSVNLKGDSLNKNGIGSWIEIYYDNRKQVYEQNPYRGYLSSVQLRPHFGLDSISKVDSLVIKWPNGQKQVMENIKANQIIDVNIKNAEIKYTWQKSPTVPNTWLKEITTTTGIRYTHNELDFVDFNIQKLLPHKFSEYGPALAVGDIDGNGLDDIIVGGSFSYSPVAILQRKNGAFVEKEIILGSGNLNKRWEDLGVVLFDVDGDNDLDLFTASGGYENEPNTISYEDKLYLNDGKGNFKIDVSGLPKNVNSKSSVRAADFDKDGDLDLFISGRVAPWNYPKPVSSFLYRNDTKNGISKFTDVTSSISPSLLNIGMISDALWTDFDNDGWQDLILTGEWMPITFMKNNKGSFENISVSSGINDKSGWWTSIQSGDFDNDGDMDYIAGNLGLNSFYRASEKYPVHIYAKDFDKNGNYDAIPTLYLATSQEDKEKKEFPVHTRDDITKQMIVFRSKFQNYKSYAQTPFSKMFKAEELLGAQVLKANYFANSYIRNNGNGKFELIPLPANTQYSCINGMVTEDFNDDGNLDLLLVGNDYGTEVSVGRYDGCNGLLMKGDGRGGFVPLSILQSGWYIPGNGKALVKLKSERGKTLLAASQNRGGLKVYENKNTSTIYSLLPHDATVMINYKNGKKQKREVGYGSSFLSQSGRFINLSKNMASFEIIDYRGNKRSVPL